mgnify:CR=1 FL=1
MNEVDLVIGGRSFVVACEEDEQEKVKEAAELINTEAEEIQGQLGRLPESKMLLLSALMISDRLIDLEVEIKALNKSVENLELSLKNYKEGEDKNSIEKIKNLKMEGLVEKILTNLETFVSQASLPNSIEKNEPINDPNSSDNNQPKLF